LPLLLLFATPVAAQEFRGTLNMRMSDPTSGQLVDTRLHLGAGKQAMVMTTPSGPLAGTEVRLVINPGANRVTMLMATAMAGTMSPGAKGFKVVTDMTQGGSAPSGNATPPTARALGTNQTIAGMRCEDYEVTMEGQQFQMCMTEALGRYSLPDMTSSNGGPSRPGWLSAFGNRNVFPLKLITGENKVSMEVVSVDRRPPAAALFDENPEGFVTPPGMPGMRQN
jgi:hypothetical protein